MTAQFLILRPGCSWMADPFAVPRWLQHSGEESVVAVVALLTRLCVSLVTRSLPFALKLPVGSSVDSVFCYSQYFSTSVWPQALCPVDVDPSASWFPARRPSHRRTLGSAPWFLLTHRTLSEKVDIWSAGMAGLVLGAMILRISFAPLLLVMWSTNLFSELMFSFLKRTKTMNVNYKNDLGCVWVTAPSFCFQWSFFFFRENDVCFSFYLCARTCNLSTIVVKCCVVFSSSCAGRNTSAVCASLTLRHVDFLILKSKSVSLVSCCRSS